MLAVLLKYLDICMTKNFPQEGNMGVLKEYFATVVPPCVNLCITLKRKDIVFENVWAAFQVQVLRYHDCQLRYNQFQNFQGFSLETSVQT